MIYVDIKNDPLSKFTSRWRPEDIPIWSCNAKGRLGTYPQWDVLGTLTIIHKLGFYRIFSIFPDSNCISDIVLPK